MLSLVQSTLNNPFTKITEKSKYYMNTSYVLSQMHLGIKVSSTKVTKEAKTFMNTPYMLSEVRGGFKCC